MSEPVLLSIQVGHPAEHGADAISKKHWRSGIFKSPVEGRVWLDTAMLTGDGQADLVNHGGVYRVVLAYSAAHYPIWREELTPELGFEIPYGAFGENFTVSDLTEETVCLGDIYSVGDAIVQVTQPRAPCWKLARRWGLKDLAARVEARGWGGWYHRVLQAGYVEAGNEYLRLERVHPEFPIAKINDLLSERIDDPAFASALSDADMLTPNWREMFARIGAHV